MRINYHHYGSGVFNDPDALRQIREGFLHKGIVPRSGSPTIENWARAIYRSLGGLEAKNYLLTQTALDTLGKIKVSRKFDVSLLATKEERVFNLWVDADHAYRIYYTKGLLVFVSANVRNPKQAELSVQYLGGHEQDLTHMDEETFELLAWAIRVVLFLDLTEPELHYIPAGKKVGTKKTGHVNETGFDVTVVTSTWNLITIRTEGFAVSGHIRAQRVGPGRQGIRLVNIAPFEKKGYTRRNGNNATKNTPTSGTGQD